MKSGIRAMLNHRMPNARLPSSVLRPGRNHRWRKARVICRLPRPQRRRCFHRAARLSGSSAQTMALASISDAMAGELRLEGRVGVFGQRAGVDRAADRDQVVAAVELRAAGHAGEPAHDVLRPSRRRLGRDVFEGDEARQQAAGLAAFLHIGRDAADLGVGEMADHAPQGQRLEEDVGIHDHDGLGPVLGEDRPDAVVQRVRLSLAALLASQMKDRAGILRHLGAHDVGRVVGAGVVDDVEAPGAGRIVDAHQRIDAGAQHVRFVPCRQHEGHARRVVAAVGIVVPDRAGRRSGTGRRTKASAPFPTRRAKHKE